MALFLIDNIVERAQSVLPNHLCGFSLLRRWVSLFGLYEWKMTCFMDVCNN